MAGLETFSFVAAMASVGLSILVTLLVYIIKRRRPMPEDVPPGESIARLKGWGYVELGLAAMGLLFLTLTIVSRTVITGHGPFSNMYEFSIAFAWGIVAMSLFFLWRYRTQIVNTIGSLVALALLIFANTLPSKPVPLVPALQQSFLLSAHVAAAMIAYGAFTMGFGAAILYLIRSRRAASTSKLEVLDDMSYLAVKIGFPFMTLLIVLGAFWADIAWGSYWSWDPKETASLVTWLLFAGYLHARLMRGWQGRRAALILIIGFAAVLFTFFGNYIFSGLHSYQ